MNEYYRRTLEFLLDFAHGLHSVEFLRWTFLAIMQGSGLVVPEVSVHFGLYEFVSSVVILGWSLSFGRGHQR